MNEPVVLTSSHPDWPARLAHLGDDAPGSLWMLGSLPPAGTPMVAVVGSRRATTGGLMNAHDIGADLAAAGIVVVSGMARGIDAAAHRGALEAGGLTVAILGCGIGVCYPPEHARLRERIAASGCVLSEAGGAEPPDTWRFPKRNRIIAALAVAVVVVEAAEKSGALSTAARAAALGREVLAVPGSTRNPAATGANRLIRDGAPTYLELRDLLDAVPELTEHLARRARPRVAPADMKVPDAPDAGDDPLLRRLLDSLTLEGTHPDHLAATLRVAPAELAVALTTLQLRGAVTEVCGGRVARTF